jgi:hypothetical protein
MTRRERDRDPGADDGARPRRQLDALTGGEV